jgi:hypothetical protein
MSTTCCLNAVMHVALVASRSKHMALFDGVSGVREWMVAAYIQTGTSCHSRKLHARHDARFEDRLALTDSQTSHRLLSWADVTINK